MLDQTPNCVHVLEAKLIRRISHRIEKGPKRWHMVKRVHFSSMLMQSKKMVSMIESKPSQPCKHSLTGACLAIPMDSQQRKSRTSSWIKRSRLAPIQAITVWVHQKWTLIISWLSNRQHLSTRGVVYKHQLRATIQIWESLITTKSTIKIIVVRHWLSESKNHSELDQRQLSNQLKQMLVKWI